MELSTEIAQRVSWLQENTVFQSLSPVALAAIAVALQPETIQEQRRIVLEDTLPAALYILHSGRIESYRTSPSSLARATGLLPGTVMYLQELLLDQPAQETTITLSDCVVWTLPRAVFQDLTRQYPDLGKVASRQLANALADVSSQLAYERDRQIALRPYLVPKIKRGIVGASRYAGRLRQEIKKASQHRGMVLIFGEPGLEKDNAAALIHFSSAHRKEPLIRLDCNTLQSTGVELFGRVGGKPGLLDWIGQGTLMLNNLEGLSPLLSEKLMDCLRTGEYTPIGSAAEPPPTRRAHTARIILISERILPQLTTGDRLEQVIKVPPLRVRKADIATQINYYLGSLTRSRGITQPKVTPEALRRLQTYDFPGNLVELESLLERALVQTNSPTELTEELFWSAGVKNRRLRFNLLNAYPKLRQFLRSSWWPDRINYGFTLGFFAWIVAVLMLGPQSRDRNLALNLFWAWWWPLILIGFPFVGRLWCAVCPFMIYGELVQKLSLWIYPRSLQSWPREQADRWGGWFIFGFFGLILLWEELWNLENVAYLSGCLLLLITAGAVTFSLLFERRFWCRYLCPIGGMNGLFAKLSMIELRAQQGICSATCTTYQCYKGGPIKGEGLETAGCPVYSHPAQLQENRDCVLCMTCLKACPHRSVELNLRPPGVELWTTHKPSAAEVSLLFLLLGAVFLHRLPETEQWLGWDLHLQQFGYHAGVSVLALALPATIAGFAHGLSRLVYPKTRSFLEAAYGYLPLVLGCSLAHYLRLGLGEAGKLLPVAVATFGGDPAWAVAAPIAVAHPAVISFLQATTIISSFWLSVVLTQKITRQFILLNLPQYLAMGTIGSWLWKVMIDL